MKSVSSVCFVLVLLLLLFPADLFATSPYQSGKIVTPRAEDMPPPGLKAEIPRFQPRADELDEIIGDTVIVGYTYWESQHNGTVGRMVGFEPDNEEHGPTTYLVWTDLLEVDGERRVKYARTWEDEEGGFVVDEFDGAMVDAGARAGYVTLAFNPQTGTGWPVYHSTDDVLVPYHSEVHSANLVEPGVDEWFPFPDYQGQEMIWPHAVATEYQGVQYIHSISNEHILNVTDEMDICYSRHEYDPATGSLVMGEQALVTSHGMNISADIGATEDGSRVAIAATVSRDWLYHADSLTAGNYNMDIWLWISEDGGQTWNWDDPIDLTSFIGPVGGPWPGERDTLRAYTDCNVYFDHDNVLHVAFTVHPFHFDPDPVVGKTSIIYHWDEVNNVFVRVAEDRPAPEHVPGPGYRYPLAGLPAVWCS